MNIEQTYQRAVSNVLSAKETSNNAVTDEEVSSANTLLTTAKSEYLKVYSEYQTYLDKVQKSATPGLSMAITFNKATTDNLNDFEPSYLNGKNASALLGYMLTSALNKGFEDGVDDLVLTSETLKQEASDKLIQINNEFPSLYV